MLYWPRLQSQACFVAAASKPLLKPGKIQSGDLSIVLSAFGCTWVWGNSRTGPNQKHGCAFKNWVPKVILCKKMNKMHAVFFFFFFSLWDLEPATKRRQFIDTVEGIRWVLQELHCHPVQQQHSAEIQRVAVAGDFTSLGDSQTDASVYFLTVR